MHPLYKKKKATPLLTWVKRDARRAANPSLLKESFVGAKSLVKLLIKLRNLKRRMRFSTCQVFTSLVEYTSMADLSSTPKRQHSWKAPLVTLLIFGAFVFFVGWGTFRVKVNEIGVMSSKTGGVCSEVIENGVFSWHWEFLLPTNVNLMRFALRQRTVEKTVSGSLPQSDIFSKDIPFDYSMKFSATCSVSKDDIVRLAKERVISSEDELDAYIDNILNEYIDSAATVILKKAYEAEKTGELFFASDINLDKLMSEQKFAEKYPRATITKLTASDLKVPSFTMYLAARKHYLESEDFLNKL